MTDVLAQIEAHTGTLAKLREGYTLIMNTLQAAAAAAGTAVSDAARAAVDAEFTAILTSLGVPSDPPPPDPPAA